MNDFFNGYITCALWSSCDDRGEPFDKNYSIYDIDPECLSGMKKECEDFLESNKEILEEYYRDYSVEYAGHDFWLSRNGHGAGFFDRGAGYKALQAAAKVYGSCDLFVGDDGKIYC